MNDTSTTVAPQFCEKCGQKLGTTIYYLYGLRLCGWCARTPEQP